MSKNTTNKQKNIDDALMSIDSLLDTASDVEPVDLTESNKDAASKAAATGTTTAQTSRQKRIARPEPSLESTKKPLAKAHGAREKPRADIQSTADDQARQANADEPILKSDKKLSGQLTQTTRTVGGGRKDSSNEQKAEKQADNAEGRKNKLDESTDLESTSKRESSSSLNFTTVDDDLSQAMRELPLLDDIVTEEDLALIGSGKEPPKKILTEAFKRLSVTDKLIQILENQLSEYNISKLEYQYLHELFEELLEKENKKR